MKNKEFFKAYSTIELCCIDKIFNRCIWIIPNNDLAFCYFDNALCSYSTRMSYISMLKPTYAYLNNWILSLKEK